MTKETTNIYDCIRAVQIDFNAPKSRYNSFGDYYYRSAEDMEAGLKPLLHKYGMTMLIDDEVVMIGDRFYVKATVSIHKGDDVVQGHGYAREVEQKTKSDPAQITGMASSYARKYALGGLFLVDDQPDADAQDNKEHSEPQSITDHERNRAVIRLKEAIHKWCEKNGSTVDEQIEIIKSRNDYMDSAQYYNRVAYQYEQGING